MSIKRLLRLAFKSDQRKLKRELLIDDFLNEELDNSKYITSISRKKG